MNTGSLPRRLANLSWFQISV